MSTSPVRTSNSEPWHGQTTTAAVELALGERALLVRARVVERDPDVAEPADAHRAPTGLDAPEATLRRVAGRTDVVPLPFRHYCAGR